jgi:hypothetical protein
MTDECGRPWPGHLMQGRDPLTQPCGACGMTLADHCEAHVNPCCPGECPLGPPRREVRLVFRPHDDA